MKTETHNMRIKLLLSILLIVGISSCNLIKNAEEQFQMDADHMRLEHLLFWSGLIEEYYEKNQQYPLQNQLKSKKDIILVKIVTKQQKQYLSPGSDKYNPRLDNNANGAFIEFGVKALVEKLEKSLARSIKEKYDIQKIPVRSTVGYYYFVTNDGYLIWTTCITCGVTKISTLLMDGFTPTVNIVSDGMKGKVTKALLRKEMMTNPIFEGWINRPFGKEKYIRQLVDENSSDSKK